MNVFLGQISGAAVACGFYVAFGMDEPFAALLFMIGLVAGAVAHARGES